MTDPNTGVVAEIGHPGISWDILDTAGTFETWDILGHVQWYQR